MCSHVHAHVCVFLITDCIVIEFFTIGELQNNRHQGQNQLRKNYYKGLLFIDVKISYLMNI
jgi:hypothetical protein